MIRGALLGAAVGVALVIRYPSSGAAVIAILLVLFGGLVGSALERGVQ